MSVGLKYPDGKIVSHPDGVTGADVARSIGPGLAKAAVAVKVDGQFLDLTRPITQDGEFSVITLDSDDGLHVLRHSSAHVMAQAVLDLYPGSSFAISATRKSLNDSEASSTAAAAAFSKESVLVPTS